MRLRLAAAVLAGAACVGCGTSNPNGVDEKPLDIIGLVDELRTAGATVQMGGEIEQPFFAVRGRVVVVNGENVQAFEYAIEAAEQRDSRLVSPDGGTIGTTAVSWVAPPHFYRKGLLIVLYVGDTPSVRSALESVLGPQFAGR